MLGRIDYLNKNDGIIVPYDDDPESIDTYDEYHFNLSDVVEGLDISLGSYVSFDVLNTETGLLCAVNIHKPSADEYDLISETVFPRYASTPRQLQEYPWYQKDVTKSLTNYLTKESSVPHSEVGKIASMLSNLVLASLDLGGTIVQTKAQKQINLLNSLSKTYKVSLNSVLKYLEKQKLLEKEQKELCFKFYRDYCPDMSTPERIKFMLQQNQHEIATKTIKIVGAVTGLAILDHTIVNTAKVLSPSYQKTERYRIKHDKR